MSVIARTIDLGRPRNQTPIRYEICIKNVPPSVICTGMIRYAVHKHSIVTNEDGTVLAHVTVPESKHVSADERLDFYFRTLKAVSGAEEVSRERLQASNP